VSKRDRRIEFRDSFHLANFGDPKREICFGANFVNFLRPVVDLPMVPVQRKTVDRDRIQMVEQAFRGAER
jgi:hypothetical protein